MLRLLRAKLASLIYGKDVSAMEADLRRTEARLNWVLVSEGMIDKDDLSPDEWAAARDMAKRELGSFAGKLVED